MSKLGKIFEQICIMLCLYVISYNLIIFIWDSHGISAYRKLLEVQKQLEIHYDQLEQHQRKLLRLSEKINDDPAYITLEARSLGYYEKEDRLILINTWFRSQPEPSPGDQLITSLAEPVDTLAGAWLYTLLMAASLWFLIRLLYLGCSNILPKELSRKEKFHPVHHGNTLSPKNQFPKPRSSTGKQAPSQKHPSRELPGNRDGLGLLNWDSGRHMLAAKPQFPSSSPRGDYYHDL